MNGNKGWAQVHGVDGHVYDIQWAHVRAVGPLTERQMTVDDRLERAQGVKGPPVVIPGAIIMFGANELLRVRESREQLELMRRYDCFHLGGAEKAETRLGDATRAKRFADGEDDAGH